MEFCISQSMKTWWG